MAKTQAQLIELVRNITGRVDASDPMFTDAIMLQKITDFIRIVSPQDIRLYKNNVWWEPKLDQNSVDPYPVDLTALGFENIGPTAYAAGYEMFWFQDPVDFYRIWPETTTYTASRPTYVLYYNNELTFRAPLDQEYTFKISAVRLEPSFDAGVLSDDNVFFHIGYGTAMNIFAEYGETDRYQEYMPIYQRYKTGANSVSWRQYTNERTSPEF